MVTYRTAGEWGPGKGVNLTAAEVDGNFYELAQAVLGGGATGVGIESIAVNGSQMTITLTDGTTQGPFTLPKAMIHYRGTWAAGASYAEMDIVTAPNNAGIFLVTQAHTAAATFDQQATGGSGAKLYQWLFPTQASTLSALSDVSETAPTDGQALVWDATAGAWVPGAGGGGGGTVGALADLTDVQDWLSPITGSVLMFDGEGWDAGAVARVLDDLDDVGAAFPSNGHVLTWNNGAQQWEAQAPSLPPASVSTRTADFTYTLTSPGTFVDYNGTASALFTIPTNATAAIPIGSVIRGGRLNTGAMRILGAPGVTLNGVSGGFVDLPDSQSEYVLRKRGTDDWRISITTTAV